MKHECDGYNSYNWCTWNGFQSLGKDAGKTESKKTSKDYSDYNIVKIGQNTEKNTWKDLLSLT